MKAIRIDQPGGPEELRLVDIPVPTPGPGEVLIAQSVAGLNFIDVYMRSGTYKVELPFVVGREGAGTIAALGADVHDLVVGERVAYCLGAKPGGYAEFAVVPAAQAVPIPAGIDDRTACAAMLQGITAQYLSASTYPIARGETVLVHAAAGGVGLLLVQLAKARGATVIGAVGSAEKAALASAAGADHVINYAQTDFAVETRRITCGAGIAAVYDSVGKDTWERSLAILRPRGYLVNFGASSGPVPPIDPLRLMSSGSLFVTRPTLVDYTRTRAELLERSAAVFAAIIAKELAVRIGATYPLAEAAQAHSDLQARNTTGKVLFTI